MSVEVRYMGQLEVPLRGRYGWVDGYAVVVDGLAWQPWMRKREAEALVKVIRKEASCAVKR